VLVGFDVSVTVAWPPALVVAVVDDSVPMVLLKLTVAPLTADPAFVNVAVIVVVDCPSPAMVVGDAEIAIAYWFTETLALVDVRMLPVRGVKLIGKLYVAAVPGTALHWMLKLIVWPAARSVPLPPEVKVTVVAFDETDQPVGRLGALPYVNPEAMVMAIWE